MLNTEINAKYGNNLEIIGYEIDLRIKRNSDYRRHMYKIYVKTI